MSPSDSKPRPMIIDSDALIDFVEADRFVLKLIVKHIGPLQALHPSSDNVRSIDEDGLLELGVNIVEEDINDRYAAEEMKCGPSTSDCMCMLTAKRQGLICVTNNIHLIKLCEEEGIPVKRGLRLLADLHKTGGISAEDAIILGRQIHTNNPKYIPSELVEEFIKIIRSQS